MEPDDAPTSYQIWASDNVVYGPVELPTLVDWVQEQRVLAGTWVYSAARETWQRAAQMEELTAFFGPKPRAGSPSGATIASRSEAPLWIKPGTLRRIKVFANMSDAQLERLLQFMESYPARQWSMIVKQGDPGDAMFLVLDGEVRVRLLIGGKETILTTLGSGEFFGEFALFDHGPRSADVVANKDALLLKISAASVQKLANEAPELAAPFLLSICRTLTARIRADNKRFQDSVRVARVAGEL